MSEYLIAYGFPGSPKYIFGIVSGELQANMLINLLNLAIPTIDRTEIIPIAT